MAKRPSYGPRSNGAYRLLRRLRSHLHRYVLAWAPRRYDAEAGPIAVLIPLAPKDLEIARITIRRIKAHLTHDIVKWVIVSPASAEVQAFAAEIGAEFVDEDTILPDVVKNDVYFVNNHNRNGWMRQQIIKMSCFDIIPDVDSVAIFDSDTMPIRDLSFREKGKAILFTSDEFVSSYQKMNTELLGWSRRGAYSFICHCAMFEKKWMRALQARIEERTGQHWIDAIYARLDRTIEEPFAEYEIYGEFVYNAAPPDAYVRRYWYNRRVKRYEQDRLTEIPRAWLRYNFVSHHFRASEAKDGVW